MEGRGHYRQYRSNGGRSTAATTSRSSPHSTTRSSPTTTSQLPRTPSLSPNSTPVQETYQSSTQAPSPHEAQTHYEMGQLTLEEILVSPGRAGLTKLDPKRPPGTQWFEIDNEVGKVVSNCIKGFFTEPHANISQTPKKIVDTWFHMFAQQYNWDNSINVLVKRQFTIKAGIRLCDIVSKWKSKWKTLGDKAMPMWMDPEVWKGLKVFWIDPHSEDKSGKCSKARNTSVGGHGPSRHTSRQKTYARRALESAEKNGGVLPPIVEIMEQTHRRKNGVFVDGLAEQICKEVSAKIAERESQLSPGHSDQPGGLSIAEKNNILLEAAPKNKKGRIYGVGSIQVIPSASSFDPPHT